MPITPSNTTFVVTTGSQKVLAGNSGRNTITFVNTDPSNNIYLSKGAAAVVGSGIFLGAGGGAHSESCNKDGIIFRGDYYAISSAGSPVMTICEEYNNP